MPATSLAQGYIRIPGVGDYIASAVLSIAGSKPHAVVDGNVKRVLARLLCVDTPVNHSAAHKADKAIAETLLYEKDPGTYNQAVMELGALVCTPKRPDCGSCPLAEECCACEKQITNLFPRRMEKRRVPTVHMGVFFCDYISGRVILNGPIDHKCVSVDQLHQFPFPRANLKFMELIRG